MVLDVQPEGKGKGKSKGKDPVKPDPLLQRAPRKADGCDQGSWQQVSRKPPQEVWALRAEDWDSPVIEYNDVADNLDKTTGVFKAIVLCTEEQVAALSTLLQGSGKVHGITAVVITNNVADERCPGACGHKLVFKRVRYTHVQSPGQTRPMPKVLGAKLAKVAPEPTVVLYARFYKHFVTPAAWDSILKTPQIAFHTWTAKRHLQVHESWGWGKEKHGSTSEFNKVFGMVRVSTKNAEALLSQSGVEGCFLDVPRWTQIAAQTTEWIEKSPKESYADYLARALTLGSKFGLTYGMRSLGKRVAREAHTKVARVWMLERVPQAWTAEQARLVVSKEFEGVEMLRQHRTKKGTDFVFRGSHTTEHDIIAIPVEDADGQNPMVYWCRWAPSKRKVEQQAIKTRSSWSLAPPRDPFATTEQVVQPPPQQDASMEPSSGQAAGTEGTETKQAPPANGKGTKRPEGNDASSNGKRACAAQRALPPELVLDGNCLFASLSEGLAHTTDEKAINPKQLRAEIVQHLTKNRERYEPGWDHELPGGTADHDFNNYLQAIAQDKTWGGLLEIQAFARRYDTRVIIYPRAPTEPVCVVQCKGQVQGGCARLQRLPFRLPPPGLWAALPEEPHGRQGGPSARAYARGRAFAGRCGLTIGPLASQFARAVDLDLLLLAWPPGAQPGLHKRRLAWLAMSARTLRAAVSTRSKCAYRHIAPVPANLLFACTLCPMKQQMKSIGAYRNFRTKHYTKFHDGQHLPGKFYRPVVRHLLPDEEVFWRCPLCPMGISVAMRKQILRGTFAAMRRAHRDTHHSKVTRAKWKKLMALPQQGPKNLPNHIEDCRRRMLAKTVMKEVQKPRYPGLSMFVFPRAKFAQGTKTILKVSCEHAWKCQKCQAVVRSTPFVKRHSKGPCPETRPAFAQRQIRRLRDIRQWLQTQKKYTDEKARLLQATDAAISACGPSTSPSLQPSPSF